MLFPPVPPPSRESAQIIRALLDAHNRRDLATTMEVWHPDLTLVPIANLGMPGTSYHGHTGLRARLQDTFERFPYVRSEVHELRDLPDRILANTSVAFGDDVDSALVEEVTWLFALKDKRVISGQAFAGEAEALDVAERPPEEHFRALFQKLSDPIVINTEDGRFVDANPAACELYGLGVEELRKRTIFDLVPPETTDRLESFWRDLRAGKQVEGESRVVLRIADHDGVELHTTADFVPGRYATVLSSRGPRRESQSKLTPRERDVFRLLAQGFTSREIADQLFVSIETVRTHVQNALARLGAKTRAQAIAIALNRGEITL
jgi:PAS domain S-box-containing protein